MGDGVPPYSDIEFPAPPVCQNRCFLPSPETLAMHVEPLEKLPRSVREFLSHYAMIVLSILTALALEQVLLGLEHHHEGERAKAEIEQEIASNRHEVEESIKVTRDTAMAWEKMLAATVADVQAGRSTNDSRLATIAEARHQFRDAVPPLKTAAWDAALSSHAVDYLDHDDLTRYSELYATQRFFAQALWDTVRDSATRSLADITLPTLTGTADPLPTIATLNARVRMLRIVESQLLQVDEIMKQPATATPAPLAPDAASAPASAAAPAKASAPAH